MNIEKLLKNDYYLNSSVSFFKSNFEKRLNFLQKKISYLMKFQILLIIV